MGATAANSTATAGARAHTRGSPADVAEPKMAPVVFEQLRRLARHLRRYEQRPQHEQGAPRGAPATTVDDAEKGVAMEAMER